MSLIFNRPFNTQTYAVKVDKTTLPIILDILIVLFDWRSSTRNLKSVQKLLKKNWANSINWLYFTPSHIIGWDHSEKPTSKFFIHTVDYVIGEKPIEYRTVFSYERTNKSDKTITATIPAIITEDQVDEVKKILFSTNSKETS